MDDTSMSMDSSPSYPADDMKLVLDRVVDLFSNPYTTASTPQLEPKETSRIDVVPRHRPEMGFSESVSMAAEIFALAPDGDVKLLSDPQSVLCSLPFVPPKLRPGYHDPKGASTSSVPRCLQTYDYFYTAPSPIPQPTRNIVEVEWSYQETARMLSASLALERLHDVARAELVRVGWTDEHDPHQLRRSSLQLNPPGLDRDEDDLVPGLLGEDSLFAITSLQNADARSTISDVVPPPRRSSLLSSSFMHSAIPPPSSDTVASDVRSLYAPTPQNELHCTPQAFPPLPSPFALHRGTSSASIPRAVTFTDDSLVASSSTSASPSGSGPFSNPARRLVRSRSTSTPSRSKSPFSLLSPARSILGRRVRSPELSPMPEVLQNQDPFDSEFRCRDFSLQSLVIPSPPAVSRRPTRTPPSMNFSELHRAQTLASPESPASPESFGSGSPGSPAISPMSPASPLMPITPPVTSSFAASAASDDVPLRMSQSPEPVVELHASGRCSPYASRPASPRIRAAGTGFASLTPSPLADPPASSEKKKQHRFRTLVKRVLNGDGNGNRLTKPGPHGRFAEARSNTAPAPVPVPVPRVPSSASGLAARAASLPNAHAHSHPGSIISNGTETAPRSANLHSSGTGAASGGWGAIVRRASTRSSRSAFSTRVRQKRSWTTGAAAGSRVPVVEAEAEREHSRSSSDEVDVMDGCDARTTTSTVATSVAVQEREKEKSWVIAGASPPTSPERVGGREREQYQGRKVGLGIAMGRSGRARERPVREVSDVPADVNGAAGHAAKGSRWSGLWH
ncbi:hypothetical protein CONPUDRAFT_136518 [Coniophora puteana RWD-64-598 SS2]|uniref:Uncharacterized protein n=1 Tax=Coniophora puteana (strain RWD-64-598) TaxID=741705 RepID=A0A5M3MT30_CONPW|nr:uncharacterized protein CONPUDRAFT_136518 [Coniophora puteana RWD-64-598 SS2]EIW81681.1 hypothetical protein CONPUDRAFT_136518 [Coniophora puteana RWD-64-598 SS2]